MSKYLAYIKQPNKFVDTLFVIGFASLYNVSVRIITDIHNEPQLYYLGLTAPTDLITLCFLQSAEHYYASRELPPMIIADPAALFAEDTDASVQPEESGKENTSPIATSVDVLQYDIRNETDINAKLDVMALTQQEENTTTLVQIIPIPQVHNAVFFSMFPVRSG